MATAEMPRSRRNGGSIARPTSRYRPSPATWASCAPPAARRHQSSNASRNTSKLNRITPAPGYGTGFLQFSYDPAGNETSILENDGEGTFKTLSRDYSEESQISALRSTPNQARTDMLYDGRGFLRQANQTFTGSTDFTTVTPTYSSEGVLYALQEERQVPPRDDDADAPVSNPPLTSNEITSIFYFAGKPIAQWNNGGELLYLTTDHLGTPVLATSDVGAVVWAGGVEPFGKVWSAGADNPDQESAEAGGSASGQEAVLSRLTTDKVFLRYPGQWASDAFRVDPRGGDLYYNVYRWYEAGTGRYTRVDPVGVTDTAPNLYAYVTGDPTRYSDPLGLRQWPFGAGKFCRDKSCECSEDPPVKVIGEDSPSFGVTPASGGCVEADAVYSAKCVVKIPDNMQCTLKCSAGAPPGQQGQLSCKAKGLVLGPAAQLFLGKKPECFASPEQLPPGWPPNPLWTVGRP
jgi:RHS repeat-associated protein